jgi:cysteinyl-tRNA synthetase
MNITDVDDKTIRDSQKEKKNLKEFTEFYSKAFFEDIETLLKSLPKSIYRVKGVVNIKDLEKPLFINYSFGDGSYQELEEKNEKSI